MKIAYAFHRDAADVLVQSGRPASILRGLRQHGVEVEEFFPLRGEVPKYTLSKIFYRLQGKHHRSDREERYLREFARQFEVRSKHSKFDLVFCPGSEVITFLKTDRPITFCADATFANMVDYYWDFTNLSADCIRKGHAQEKAALSRASLAVYPSEWAAKSAIEDYGAAREKVVVIPFGANLGKENSAETVAQWVDARSMEELRLLFVGRHWQRKGGSIAVETVRLLRKEGLSATLDVVGCTVPYKYRNLEWIRPHGSLELNDPTQTERLSRLFSRAHFVLIPSSAEAFGMTFCEGNAFGVPAISYDTGGISEIIRDGINGFKVDPDAGPEEFKTIISNSFCSPESYRTLALSSYQQFAQRLNWNTYISRFLEKARSVCGAPESSPRRAFASPLNVQTSTDAPASRPFRMAFVYDDYLDPAKPSSWSGLPYYILKSFEKEGATVVPVRLRQNAGFFRRWLTFLFYRFFRGERYLRDRDHGLLRDYARQIERSLENLEVDAAFCPGSAPFSFVTGAVPLVFWSDGTFLGLSRFYASFSNLAAKSLEEGESAERAALRNTSLAIYASDWAAATAVDEFGADPDKVRVVPFGANLDHVPDEAEIAEIIGRRDRTTCALLFSGVDWIRKGADHAIRAAEALNEMGIPTHLDIIGCLPPKNVKIPSFVSVKGFVSKTTEEGRKQISTLLCNAHFFLLPSRAEAFGIVFCEASAFGVPCLATRVGGIATAVRDGINGQLFSMDESGDAFAEFIAKLWHNPTAYKALALSSHQEYRQRLNWSASARKVIKHMREISSIPARETTLV